MSYDIFGFGIFGDSITVALIAGLLVYLLFIFNRPKGKASFLFERLKPGYTRMVRIKEERTKNPGDILLTLPDKRKFIVASAKEGEAETLEVPNSIKIPKGWLKFWWLESGKIVKLGWTLLSQPTEIMDNETSTMVANRRTAGKLSTKALGGNSWTILILAACAGLAFGYIMYPLFNHPNPVIEYCQHLANGTLGACSPFP